MTKDKDSAEYIKLLEEPAILTAIKEAVREVVSELGMEAVLALSMFPSAAEEIATLRQPTQSDALKMAQEALRNIQIEAEREQGSWVHLKRVIALNCKQTLAALQEQSNG